MKFSSSLFIIILLLVGTATTKQLQFVFAGSSTSNGGGEVVVPCNVDDDDELCSTLVGKGSVCLPDEGICSNRFERGCLYSLMEDDDDWDKLRVCNSDDPPNAASIGLCSKPEFDYLEIRIGAGDWESVVLESWLIQIVLSELLGVPSTIEGQTYDSQLNFYDRTSKFQYGHVFDWVDLENANKYKDCQLASRNSDAENYEACAHFVPEFWQEGVELHIELLENDAIEPPQGMGLLGWQTWFIPKKTAKEDPSLLSYFGLMGESNRQKLASKFPRPTSWYDYCTYISKDNCTQGDDGIAKRPPLDDWESNRYYSEGLYTGYFRNTTQNDCTLYPSTCTGHFADYPCSWPSYFQQNSYHLNIALESNGNEPGSGGYTFTQLQDIWRAANSTKSNVMMMWYAPELLVQEFAGTDYEFQRVLLPFTTQECIDSRVDYYDVCSDDMEKRYGSPLGVCEIPPSPLYKIISSSVLDWTYNNKIVEATKSPAHEVLELFRLNDAQMGNIFDKLSKATPREAICEWVVDNIDFVKGFVPRTYPRTMKNMMEDDDQNSSTRGLSISTYVFAGVAIILVLIAAIGVFQQRKRRVMVFAQVEFLYLLLFGLLLISLAALLTAITPPTDPICVSSFWLVNLGYSVELIPLLVKVSTINRLANAAKRMRRVQVPRSRLFGVAGIICSLVFIFLLVATIVDPPRKLPEYELTDTVTENDETVVNVNYYCSSEMDFWRYNSLAWIVILLICATVLAIQARNLIEVFNESQTLAIMIYSHTFFLVLRLITFFLGNVVSRSTLALYESLIYSLDVVATIAIYFVPKFTQQDKRTDRSLHGTLSSIFVVPQQQQQSQLTGGQGSDGSFKECTYCAGTGRVSTNHESRHFLDSGDRSKNEESSLDIAGDDVEIPLKDGRGHALEQAPQKSEHQSSGSSLQNSSDFVFIESNCSTVGA